MRSRLSIAANEEGERMRHIPVLPAEVLEALRPAPGGLFLDATLGAGGHAESLLEATAPGGRLIGLDRDAAAVREASLRLARFGARFVARHSDFRDIRSVLEDLGIERVDGVLADLGVSSDQLLDPARGFGFSADGPLDMRMDRSRGETAAQLLARLGERELAALLKRFGQEPRAAAIARAIVREREREAVDSTRRLAGIVSRACRWGTRSRVHPATRTFMALRIAVNDELSGLDAFVRDAARSLRPGGRLAIVSFHSLEDRAVKNALRALTGRCSCPPGLPVCGCGRPDLLRVLTRKPITPSPAERESNPRARSARLRVAERA